ncbi:MAG: spore cortex biosynthesis protein YabQ [Clostridia bacterium]|nr:spore cortex biosynthesis protein YabQ [Clostridia bacterium]
MVYIQGVAEQTRLFLLSIGFGFLLGILYDVFRMVRLVISNSKPFVLFMDLLYFAFCTFLNFCYILTLDYGKIRIYIVFAQLLGWLIYYFSFGAIAIRVSRFASLLVKRSLSIMIRPLKFVIRKIKQLISNVIKFFKKIFRKSTKKTKFSLQKRRSMVYNLRGYLEKCTQTKKQRN